jgi:hypothetical protein
LLLGCQRTQQDGNITPSTLGEEQNRLNDKDKLLQIEENKIKQSKLGLSRIQDGWEKGIYTEDEVVPRVKELRKQITNSEKEIENINDRYRRDNLDLDSLRQELVSIRSKNLKEASFEEKAELIARLGVKVIPDEDLKTRRICCRLNVNTANKEGDENGLTKVTFGGAYEIRTRDFPDTIGMLFQKIGRASLLLASKRG